jgi:hypothetical protein
MDSGETRAEGLHAPPRLVPMTAEGREALRRAIAAGPRDAVLMVQPDDVAERIARAREAFQVPLPLADWHAGIGPAIWWRFPVTDKPWIGTPACPDWPGHHTHWTVLPGVLQPDGSAP